MVLYKQKPDYYKILLKQPRSEPKDYIKRKRVTGREGTLSKKGINKLRLSVGFEVRLGSCMHKILWASNTQGMKRHELQSSVDKEPNLPILIPTPTWIT